MALVLSPVSMAGGWFCPTSIAASQGVAIKLRPLTAAEYSAIVHDKIRSLVDDGKSVADARLTGPDIVRAAFELCILDTRGVQIHMPDMTAPAPPASGGALFDALASSSMAHSGLIDEIYNQILTGSELSGERLGNCAAPLDSLPQPTTKAGARSNGDAMSVAAKEITQANSTPTN